MGKTSVASTSTSVPKRGINSSGNNTSSKSMIISSSNDGCNADADAEYAVNAIAAILSTTPIFTILFILLIVFIFASSALVVPVR